MRNIWLSIFSICLLLSSCGSSNFLNIDDDPLVSDFTNVQPLTGIVVWDTNVNVNSGAHMLEFSYILYSDVVTAEGVYDWSVIDDKLNEISSRNHHAILRLRFTYVGQTTAVPQYIKDLPDYVETEGTSEGQTTWFPDWGHQELQDFTLAFYEKFADRYDNDNRLAFLQVGFGLWAEYHIYDGPFILGDTFPSKDYQASFINKLGSEFNNLHWAISIGANEESIGPFREDVALLDIPFGLFDDSFMSEQHSIYNEPRYTFFGLDRYERSPLGGEFNYFTAYDQENVLSENGAHGESYESFADRLHISYMLGNDQYSYQTADRIKEASIHTGYKFVISQFEKGTNSTVVTVKNIGTAPIYYDTYLAINGVRSTESLISLLPNQEQEFTINYVGEEPLIIESDKLLSGQVIDFLKAY